MLKTFKVHRSYVSPERRGDEPDLLEVDADSREQAIQQAQAILGKPGTYQVV